MTVRDLDFACYKKCFNVKKYILCDDKLKEKVVVRQNSGELTEVQDGPLTKCVGPHIYERRGCKRKILSKGKT